MLEISKLVRVPKYLIPPPVPHSTKVNMWHKCHSHNKSRPYYSVTPGMASEFSMTHNSNSQEKASKTICLPAACHLACHWLLDISRRAGPNFANTVHVCTCVHTQQIIFIFLRKEAYLVGLEQGKIMQSVQSGNKVDRHGSPTILNCTHIFSTEGTVKSKEGTLLLFLTCYTITQ